MTKEQWSTKIQYADIKNNKTYKIKSINPSLYVTITIIHQIWNQSDAVVHWGKDVVFNKFCWDNWLCIWNKICTYLYSFQKL